MLLQEEIPIPVYLAWEDEAFAGIYSQLTTAAQADKNSSAAGGKGTRPLAGGEGTRPLAESKRTRPLH